MFDRPPNTDEYNIELPEFQYENSAFLNLSNQNISALLKVIDDSANIRQFKKRLKIFMTTYHQNDETFNFDEFYEKFIKRVRERRSAHLKVSNISLSDSFFETINNVPSYIFMALVAILDVAALTTLGLSVFTILLSSLTLGSSIFYVIAEHRERKKMKLDVEADFELLFSRLACTEAITYCLEKNKRAALDISTEEHEFKPHPLPKEPYKPFKIKDLIITLKPAIIKGVMTTTMLLGTYYLGMAIILTAVGATVAATAMLGPIGLGIAVGIALVMGLYCGYRQFRQTIEDGKIQKLKSNIQKTCKILDDHISDLYRSMCHPRNHEAGRSQQPTDATINRRETTRTNEQNQRTAMKGMFAHNKQTNSGHKLLTSEYKYN